MIMNARARQISVWDTVDLAVRVAVHTTDPKSCHFAMATLIEELGDDVPLRQAFLAALCRYAEVGSNRGEGRILAYQHAAQAYMAMRVDSKIRQCDVDLLMAASQAEAGHRFDMEDVVRFGEGIEPAKVAMLFVLAAGYSGEDAQVKFARLQGSGSYYMKGQIYGSRKLPGLIGGGPRDVRLGRMFAPIDMVAAAKEMGPASLAA